MTIAHNRNGLRHHFVLQTHLFGEKRAQMLNSINRRMESTTYKGGRHLLPAHCPRLLHVADAIGLKVNERPIKL